MSENLQPDIRNEPTYGGMTAEARRARRRAQLLDAALELVGSGGWSAVGVRAVCAAAGLSSRYFYESFSSREELVLALFDAVAEEQRVVVLAAVRGAPREAEPRARAAIGAAVDRIAETPAKAQVLYGTADDVPALGARRVALVRLFAAMVAAQGRDFYGLDGDGGEALVATTAAMLAGGLSQALLDWAGGELATTADELIGDLAMLFVAAGEAAVTRLRRAG